ALQRAHNKNILHRDIKLENVFYSPEKKQYKLGDFGIAKMTQDGFASTVAFTKGYAAPEVRGIQADDQYDNTADIYSFGIMLFVLMNHMKFPDSDTYNVNLSMQYSKGYIVPRPENASEQFYQVIARLCMFDPDKRYQSMEEVITDIERLMYSEGLSHKKEHKDISLIVGMLFLFSGVAACKLTLVPEMEIPFSIWEYMFWICCFGKFLLKVFKKNSMLLSMVVFGIGIYLMAGTGFSWIRLILLVGLTFSSGISAGFLSGGALTANFIYIVQLQNDIWQRQYSEYSWLAVTLISLSVVLLYQYALLVMEDRKVVKQLYKRGFYWMMIVLLYGLVLLTGVQIDKMGDDAVFMPLVRWLYDMGVDHYRVGVSGLVFCVFWTIREKVLIRNEKRKKPIDRQSF
ncbi:MAG: protein kinase, partial [Lachnospiraceae bacterium]|nr:protein kinase [Lachnospiraceae bacterium]